MSLGHAIRYNRESGDFEFSEGYRYEDLTKENQDIIWWCRHLVEQLDGFKEDVDYYINTDKETTIDKIKKEIAIEIIEKVEEYLDGSIDEIQVSLADSQEDGEE